MANERKIDYLLLGLLSHESLTGYEMKKRLNMRLRFFWNASYGSIYPALSGMEAKGEVELERRRENGRDKVTYTITEKGREHLREWLKQPVIKDELRYETLLKLFFGRECGAEITLSHIDAFEEKIRQELPFLRDSVKVLGEDTSDETHKYYRLTAMFGVKTYETYLEWCSQAREILQEGCAEEQRKSARDREAVQEGEENE